MRPLLQIDAASCPRRSVSFLATAKAVSLTSPVSFIYLWFSHPVSQRPKLALSFHLLLFPSSGHRPKDFSVLLSSIQTMYPVHCNLLDWTILAIFSTHLHLVLRLRMGGTVLCLHGMYRDNITLTFVMFCNMYTPGYPTVSQDSDLLWYDAVFLGEWFLLFQRITVL